MNDEPIASGHWQMPWWAWALTVVALLLLLLVGTWAGWRVTLQAKVNEKVEAIRAAGYPMSSAELDAWYPYPQGANAADVLEEARLRYREVELPGGNESLPIFGSGALPEPGLPLPASEREALLMIVEANQDTIERLHKAAAIPESRFPVDFREAFPDTPHLGVLRRGARLLQAGALLALDAGDSDRAWRHVVSMLGLSRTLSEEPILISMVVAIGQRGQAFDTMQHVLSRTDIAPEAIEAAADLLEEATPGRHLIRAAAGQRAGLWSVITDETSDPESLADIELRHASGWRRMAGLHMLGRVDFLDGVDVLIDFISHQPVETWREQAKQHLAILEERNRFDSYLAYQAEYFFSFVTNALYDIAYGRIVRLAAAVERFRQDHGRIPESLSELEAEGFVIPLDPMDGQPLRYRRLDHGYLIHSVGANGVDEDGVSRRTNSDADDLPFRVQRIPASAANQNDAGSLAGPPSHAGAME